MGAGVDVQLQGVGRGDTFMPAYASLSCALRQCRTICATSSGCGWSHTWMPSTRPSIAALLHRQDQVDTSACRQEPGLPLHAITGTVRLSVQAGLKRAWSASTGSATAVP